jgi:hypothetical protein
MTTPNQKRATIEAFLSSGGTVSLLLDGRHPDVDLPTRLCSQNHVQLDIGLNMSIPIPDLEIDDAGITATLSFNRSPELCFVPWGALWGARSGIGKVIWPADVPSELRVGPPKVPAAAAPTLPAGVLSLDARRTAKARAACNIRRSKLTTPGPRSTS